MAGLCFHPKSLMLHISMDLSRRDLQHSYWKDFVKFQIRVLIIGRKPKNIQTNIDQSVMRYVSLDSSPQALQTNGKFFFFF